MIITKLSHICVFSYFTPNSYFQESNELWDHEPGSTPGIEFFGILPGPP